MSILSHEENCFVSGIAKDCRCKHFPFWLDGRFIREYLGFQNKDYGKKFIWTDGSKMIYQKWEKRSNYRGNDGCGNEAEWRPLIGRYPSRYSALIGWDHDVVMPDLSYHKDTIQYTQSPLLGAFLGFHCVFMS